jgi:hypothetical protein
MRSFSRARLGVLVAIALAAGVFPSEAAPVIPPATPRAVCGPGSIPEPDIQGRTPPSVYAAGTGVRCNMEMIGHAGTLAGFRTYRYVDKAGHVCAYYDSTPYLQPRPNSSFTDPDIFGTHVLNVADPAHPKKTAELETPAMRSPHESLNLNLKRGLLAADLGNLVVGPGFVDVYSVKNDCRHPTFLSTLPIGQLGHEGTFSPDGLTFWSSNPVGGYLNKQIGGLTAIDVSRPRAPRVLWSSALFSVHGLNIGDDGRTLYYADAGPRRGLTVLDVSDIQKRKLNPQVRRISHLTWDTVSIPQTPLPVTIGGHPYLVEVDEFTHDTITNFFTRSSFTRPEDMVGAARIIDIADPAHPRVVSDIRLEVNQPSVRNGAQRNDPGAGTATGYTGHYCAVPSRVDPKIVACSFILSGLRVFDIRDPLAPKEIAYFNPPTTTGAAYQAMSAPAFVPERNEIWYTDANYGFYTLRVTNGAWPS